MTTKTQMLLTLTAGTTLALGCAASSTTSASATPPNPTASATADSSVSDLQPTGELDSRSYLYAYDYDNDGGYAKALSWNRTDTDDSLDERTRYAYRYDRNGDGNPAKKRAPLPPVDRHFEVENVNIAELRIPLQLDPSLEMACKKAKPTFFFEYDSAKLPEQVDSDFDNIVNCLQHTSLEDADVEVIGHADARGSNEYNRDLGLERAEAVAAELEDAGLRDDRIQVISRGEAKADAPNHWDDRRVVIRMR